MAGEALAKNRLDELEGDKISKLRPNQEMAEENDRNDFNVEASGIRQEMLEKMNREKGVISKDEESEWKQKVTDNQEDLSRLRSIKNEFEEHWRQSFELRQKFEGKLSSAGKEGMLKQGEDQKLAETFTESGLKAKEKALQELEKELKNRQQELKKFLKLEKAVQEKRRTSLDKAENYDEKLRVLESSESENKNFQKYRQIFNQHKAKLSKKTTTEYLEWFLTLSENEQNSALNKVEKDDIQPRIELFDVHQDLPREYQDGNFKEWGLTRREQFLGSVEKKIEREYRKLLRQDASGVFCKESLRFCERNFQSTENNMGKRFKHKITFLKALPGQIKAEKELWNQFEKFPSEIQDILEKEFSESDFEAKKKILTGKATKTADQYGKLLNQLNNKMDPHIAEAIRGNFEKAPSLEEKAKIIKQGNDFQKSKNRYFAKWKKNEAAFRSDIGVYEKWYGESINSLEAAKKAESDLNNMIDSRQKVHKAVEKLPSHLKNRMNANQSLGEREKDLHKLEEIARNYTSTIPFLLQNAEKAEQAEDLDQALNFYMQALKMDPESPDLKTLVAHLRQKGASPSLTPANATDEQQNKKLLAEVDGMSDITQDAEDLARKQILFNLSKKHHEQSGASGSTTQARAKKSIRNLDKKDQSTAETIIEQHGDSHTVDETGTIRKKKKIKMRGAQVRATEEQLGQFFGEKQHKGEVTKSGLAEVAFQDDSGREVELSTAEKELTAQTERLAQQREKRFLKLVQNDAGLNADQLKSVREAYTRSHDEDERVEDEIERLAA